MKRISRLSVAAMIAVWVAAARADEGAQKPMTELDMQTLVVSPTRSEQSIAETAPSITVITAEELQQKQVVTVADALREVPGVDDVEAELTFDPPWTPERMSEDAKFILGIG